jgi:hypothetical protein
MVKGARVPQRSPDLGGPGEGLFSQRRLCTQPSKDCSSSWASVSSDDGTPIIKARRYVGAAQRSAPLGVVVLRRVWPKRRRAAGAIPDQMGTRSVERHAQTESALYEMQPSRRHDTTAVQRRRKWNTAHSRFTWA